MSHNEELAYYIRALDRMTKTMLSDNKKFFRMVRELTGFVDSQHYLNGYYHYWNRTSNLPLAYDSRGKQV